MCSHVCRLCRLLCAVCVREFRVGVRWLIAAQRMRKLCPASSSAKQISPNQRSMRSSSIGVLFFCSQRRRIFQNRLRLMCVRVRSFVCACELQTNPDAAAIDGRLCRRRRHRRTQGCESKLSTFFLCRTTPACICSKVHSCNLSIATVSEFRRRAFISNAAAARGNN